VIVVKGVFDRETLKIPKIESLLVGIDGRVDLE
jgi:hypothetical protein